MKGLYELENFNTIAIIGNGDFGGDESKLNHALDRIEKLIEESYSEDAFISPFNIGDYSSYHIKVRNGFKSSFLIVAIITQVLNG